MRKFLFFGILLAIVMLAVVLFSAAPPVIKQNSFTTNAAALFVLDDANTRLTLGVGTGIGAGARLGVYGSGTVGALALGTGAPDSATATSRLWSTNGDMFVAFGGSGATLYFAHNDDNGLTKEASLTDAGVLGLKSLRVTNAFAYVPGAGASKVLTSDASGNASWAAASGGSVVSVNATNLNPINLTNSATVTWAISGSNVTATASPAALTWITLTQSGTNISGFDPALGNYFRLTITNNAFIPAPSTLPSTTTPQNIELWILEDSVGTWSVTWATNYAFMNRSAPQQTTNANAIDIYTLSAHAFTNNIFSVVQTPYF